MTDKEWHHLSGKMRKSTYCVYKGGENCTARDGRRCAALRDTRLIKGECVFFRDKREMTEEELEAYDQIAFPSGRKYS